MHIVQATYRDGVFSPDTAVPFTEGAKVTLQVQSVASADCPPEDATRISADPLIDTDEIGAPCDLPMPGEGSNVPCEVQPVPLPDPPLLRNPTTIE